MNNGSYQIIKTGKDSSVSDNCIFWGNGFNRALYSFEKQSKDCEFSWDNLLAGLEKKFGISYDCRNLLTLEFERMVYEYLSKKAPSADDVYYNIFDSFKDELRKNMSDISFFSKKEANREYYFYLLEMIRKKKISSIITTNYDYNLEFVIDEKFRPSERLHQKIEEKYPCYCPFPNMVHGIEFYHAHGQLDNPKTMCLGYRQYSIITAQLEHDLVYGRDRTSDGNNINEQEYVRNARKKAKNHKPSCVALKLNGIIPFNTPFWGEKFFTSNVAFVGFGLDKSEMDIWWVITFRAFLYYVNHDNMRNKIKNRVVFYDLINCGKKCNYDNNNKPIGLLDKANDSKIGFYKLLASNHIDINLHPIFDDNEYDMYYYGYQDILKDIYMNGIAPNICYNEILSYKRS